MCERAPRCQMASTCRAVGLAGVPAQSIDPCRGLAVSKVVAVTMQGGQTINTEVTAKGETNGSTGRRERSVDAPLSECGRVRGGGGRIRCRARCGPGWDRHHRPGRHWSFAVRRARSILSCPWPWLPRMWVGSAAWPAEGINQESVHPNRICSCVPVAERSHCSTSSGRPMCAPRRPARSRWEGRVGLRAARARRAVSGGLVLTIDCPTLGAEGCTPGFWKNHLEAWAPTGFAPDQALGSVFDAAGLGSLAPDTLSAALSSRGWLGARGSQADSAPPGGRRPAQRCAPRRRLRASQRPRSSPRSTPRSAAGVGPRSSHEGRADGCQRSRLRPELSAEFDATEAPSHLQSGRLDDVTVGEATGAGLDPALAPVAPRDLGDHECDHGPPAADLPGQRPW